MKGRYVDDPAVELLANYAGRGIRVRERCTGEQKASTRASSVALWARENEQKAACPRKMMLSL